MVEKGDDRDPAGNLALAALSPPTSLEPITARQPSGPCIASKVGNEDDERPLDVGIRWLELDGGQLSMPSVDG
jgi:hypothetical protein